MTDKEKPVPEMITMGELIQLKALGDSIVAEQKDALSAQVKEFWTSLSALVATIEDLGMVEIKPEIQLPLPFTGLKNIATPTAKGLESWINGAPGKNPQLVYSTPEFQKDLIYEANGRVYWNNWNKDFEAKKQAHEEKAQAAFREIDSILLRHIYTYILEHAKDFSDEELINIKESGTITLPTKKFIRWVGGDFKYYPLYEKLEQFKDLKIIVTSEQTGELYIRNMLQVVAYGNEETTLNISGLLFSMGAIRQMNQVEHKNGKTSQLPTHAYYLTAGSRHGGQSAFAITEAIIAQIVQAGPPKGDNETITINVNLWAIMNNNPLVLADYGKQTESKHKNTWLKRNVQSVIKNLKEDVATVYKDFVIHMEQKELRGKIQIKWPSSTTIKKYKMKITHAGKIAK